MRWRISLPLLAIAASLLLGRPPLAQAADEDGLDLTTALARALTQHPDLQSFDWELRALDAEISQSDRRPNPTLATEAENFAGSGDFGGLDQVETTLSLSQRFELGGKRSSRRALAELRRDSAAWTYEVARLDVLSQTQTAFFRTLAAQELVELDEELVSIAEDMVQSVARRIQAGATLQLQESRARAERAATRLELERARAELLMARLQLASMWGATEAGFDRVMGDFDRITAPPTLAALSSALERNPKLARWVTEIEIRNAEVQVARSLRHPDLELGLGARRFSESGDQALLLSASFDLPLFDRNQGARQAAALRIERDRAQQRAQVLRARSIARRVHAAAERDYRELESLQSETLPVAWQAYSEAQEAFALGRIPFTDVLDTKRWMFDLEQRRAHTKLRYLTELTELQRLRAASGEDFMALPGSSQR